MGSDGGSVGRAVASDTRDPQFESQHWQSLIYQLQLNRKDESKEKEARNGPSFNKIVTRLQDVLEFLLQD